MNKTLRGFAVLPILSVLAVSCTAKDPIKLEEGWQLPSGGAGGAGTEPNPVKVECVGSDAAEKLVTSESAPKALEVDDGFVYWVDEGVVDDLQNRVRGAVRRISVDGGEEDPRYAVELYRPFDLEIDGESLFVLAGDPTSAALIRVGSDGNQETIARERKSPAQLRVGGEHVYWVDARGVVRLEKTSGLAPDVEADAEPVGEVLVPDESPSIAVDGGIAYWWNGPAVGEDKLPLSYYAEAGEGDGDEGAVRAKLTSDDTYGQSWFVTVHGGEFFVAARTKEQNTYVRGYALEGDRPAKNYTSIPYALGGIATVAAADDVSVVLNHPSVDCGGMLVSAPLATGAHTVLADGLEGQLDLADDEDHIYWIEASAGDQGVGSIMKLAKP